MTNDNVLPSLTQAWVKFSDKNVEEATQAIFKSSELRGNVEVGTSLYSICHPIKNKPPRTTTDSRARNLELRCYYFST